MGALAAAALLSSGAISVARAQQIAAPASVANATQAGDLTVGVDKALVLAMPGPGATVFVANPDIADVQAPDSRRLLIFGKKPGQTTVYVFAASGAVSRYAVTVRRDAEDVASALQTQFPDATVSVSRGPGGMTVSGRVASPAEADTLKAAAQQYLAEKESLNFAVAVDESTQVNLQIRVAEVSRQVTSELGFNWDAVFNNGTIAVGLLTGRETSTAFGQFTRDTSTSSLDSLGVGYKNGPVDVSALIDALQSNGLVTILAEPNLTAISGATATFLSGGEFPVPVSQSLDQISIEWKKYGVNVDFTPVVLSSNRISIRVRPEVSELSDVGAVKVNNISIPSVAVRRADTTVELASGQSFAIAGLFENSMSNTVQRFPGLGDLPMFGALFRSSTFKRSESELVFIVTPYIVRPVSHPSDLHLPTEAINYSNDLERILLGDLSQPDKRKPAADARPHLAGPAGFMLEDQP
ncbi:MAG: type II and III secretion system protein family protein [Caulobacteraceae bacterium]|nr:type II and III secretion system protein family protein [Caulobacteraceae bacterium]